MLIFLDIDGVMVPAKSWQSPELLNDGFPAFSAKAVAVLQRFISEDTTVMLTTSHKSRFTIEQWKEIFQNRGLQVSKLKSLDTDSTSLSRKEEVLNWFNANSVHEDFVIIDDDKSLNDLPPHLKDKLILTSAMIGLNETHLHEIDAVLCQKSQTV